MSRNDELRQLTEAWNNAWNSRDADQLAAFFEATSTYYEPDLATGPVAGAAGVKTAAEKTWAEWPAANFHVVTITIQEPRVVLEWRSTATHRTGKSVQLEGVDILEWQGAKLAAARVYYDEHRRRKDLDSA